MTSPENQPVPPAPDTPPGVPPPGVPPPGDTSPSEEASPRSVMTSWLVALIVIGAFTVLFPAAAKTAAIFVLTLSVLVFVHEWGHYQFARWGGMKVNRFAIGFPPWIFTKRRNGIDYSLGALPIGGMVDIAGLGSEEEMVATAKGEAVAQPTRVARRDVAHGERLFHEASLGWRFWTLFAGPMMNFLFAIVLFIGLFSLIGVPVADVTPKIDYVLPDSPADKAGIKAGDTLLAVEKVRSDKTNDLALAIQNSKNKVVNVTLLRDGKEITRQLQPTVDELEAPSGKIEKKPMIGVQFHDYIKSYEKVSFFDAVKLGWYQSYDITQRIFGFLGRLVSNNLTKSDKRGVGGPVKIAQVIGNQADKGWLPVLLLAAGLSVNLGLMNLLPFPALDGGRILFLAYELVMRRPFDPRKEGLVHTVGMVLLLAFMLFITIHDVLPMIRG